MKKTEVTELQEVNLDQEIIRIEHNRDVFYKWACKKIGRELIDDSESSHFILHVAAAIHTQEELDRFLKLMDRLYEKNTNETNYSHKDIAIIALEIIRKNRANPQRTEQPSAISNVCAGVRANLKVKQK